MSSEVYLADQSDHCMGIDSVMKAQVLLNKDGIETKIEEPSVDKGCNAAEQFELPNR